MSFCPWRYRPMRFRASSFWRFLVYTQIHTTIGRIPQDEGSARRGGLTIHNNHNRQTSMPLAGLKPAIPASDRPAADPRLRPLDQWESPTSLLCKIITNLFRVSCQSACASLHKVGMLVFWFSGFARCKTRKPKHQYSFHGESLKSRK